MGNGVLGGPPPRTFINMKCSRSDSRPILGIGFVNGGVRNLWCEYLWVAISPCRGGLGVPPKKI